jgi:hypothetical protein
VYVNNQNQTTNQQLSKSNLQASKDNEDRPIPTVVNDVTWVKIHKKSDQKYDYIDNNIGEMEKSKKHKVLLLGDSHVRGCTDLIKMKLNNLVLLEL